MAMCEGISLHIQDKHQRQHSFLENRNWEGNSHIGNRLAQASFFYDLAKSLRPQQVCEIGFNGGHSAAIFLAAMGGKGRLTAFDFGEWAYSQTAISYVETLYPEGRLEFVKGNSAVTVPDWTQKNGRICDLFSVDGDHVYEGVKVDIKNAIKATRPGGTIILDDMNPASDAGTRRAFDDAVKAGLLIGNKCIECVRLDVSYIHRYDVTNVRQFFWCMVFCNGTNLLRDGKKHGLKMAS